MKIHLSRALVQAGPRFSGRLVAIAGAVTGLTFAGLCEAQDLEPRRWGHLPVGVNFAGVGYIETRGDIAFDPVLRIEDGEVELHTVLGKYIRSFELMGKSARFDLTQAYQDGSWTGLIDGVPAVVNRSGSSDTVIRFAVNLMGAPPLAGKEFAAYRAGVANCDTIVGAGLVVVLPTGDYLDEKLVNLGENRFTFRPQLGLVHSRGPWSYEFTGSAWFYTDNDEFWNGHRLSQDPLIAVRGHLIHTFRPGLWLGVSLGYGFGRQTTVDGVGKDDRKSQLVWGLTVGLPLSRSVGVKFGYIGSRTLQDTGADLNHVACSISVLW